MKQIKTLMVLGLLFVCTIALCQDCPKDFVEALSYNTAAGGTVSKFQPGLEILACKQNYSGHTGQNVWWSVKGFAFHYKRVEFTKEYQLACGNTIKKRVILLDLKVGEKRTGSTFHGDMDLADGFFRSDCDVDDLNRVKSVSVSNITCILADDEPLVIAEKERLAQLAKKAKATGNVSATVKTTKPELTDDEKLNQMMMKNLEKDFNENKNPKKPELYVPSTTYAPKPQTNTNNTASADNKISEYKQNISNIINNLTQTLEYTLVSYNAGGNPETTRSKEKEKYTYSNCIWTGNKLNFKCSYTFCIGSQAPKTTSYDISIDFEKCIEETVIERFNGNEVEKIGMDYNENYDKTIWCLIDRKNNYNWVIRADNQQTIAQLKIYFDYLIMHTKK